VAANTQVIVAWNGSDFVVTATGDLVGPSSATDTAITLFDGATGKLVKNSLVTVSAAGAIVAPQAGSTIPFYFANQAAFPSAATYHGALAHSHSDGAMYFAHSSAWVRLLDANTAVTVAQGGTGLTTTPANGALDIGNGSGFTRTTLTAGSNVTITNASGAITIASSGASAATPTALGTVYGAGDTGAYGNSFYGYESGNGNTASAANNTALGHASLYTNASGTWCTAAGFKALYFNNGVGTDFNTAFGGTAMYYNTLGTSCTAIGYRALFSNTTASQNTAVGYQSIYTNSTGANNTAVGYQALKASTTASDNTAVGFYALLNTTTGEPNSAFGKNALKSNTTGTNNTALGQNALRDPTTASNNTAIGHRAGESLAGNGAENVLIGVNAGNYSTILDSGSQNVCIGTNVSTGSNNNNATITIGYQIQGQGNGYVTLGSPSGKVYNQFTTNATWTQTSDVRLKTNIQNDSLGLSFINRLRPVKFNWKPSNEIDQSLPQYGKVNVRNTDTVIHGLIAQEVKAAMDAENCSTFNGWTAGSENDDVQGLSREMFITPLIKAVQELTAQIENIKSEFDAYKATHP